MNTFRTLLACAVMASSTLGSIAISTAVQAGPSCPPRSCGFNGVDLNGVIWNGTTLQGTTLQGTTLQGTTLQGISMQGTALNGAQAGEAIAVTLPNGETLTLE